MIFPPEGLSMKKPVKETLGDLLVQSLTEVRDGLQNVQGKLTMKTVEIADPPHFTAAAIHKLRDRLGLSQGLFAQLLGVSRKLVEAWEGGPSTSRCNRPAAFAVCPTEKRRVV
jgi:DNA-binding transcriptional regulator YiaG